jgi:hypothetical protein
MATTKLLDKPAPAPYKRGEQPRCVNCNHADTFHPEHRATRCTAMGCRCERLVLAGDEAVAL